MRWRERLVLASALVLALGGCSRLSFVKPDASRGRGEGGPDYRIRDNAGKRRQARRQITLPTGTCRPATSRRAAAQAALKADASWPRPDGPGGRRQDARTGGTHHAEAAPAGAVGMTFNNYGAWLCANGRAAESLSGSTRPC